MKLTTIVILVMHCASAIGAQATSRPAAKPKAKPKHLLRYALHKGRTGKFDLLSQSGVTGMGVRSQQETWLMRCTWSVLEVESGWANVEFDFARLKVPGVEQRGLSGPRVGPMYFRMNARGQVRQPKEPGKNAASDTMMIRLIVRELPAEPVAVGDRWTTRLNVPMGEGKAEMEVRNRVRSFRKGQVGIDFSLSFANKQGVVSITSEGSAGSLDCRLGDFLPSRLTQRMKMSIKANGRVQGASEGTLRLGPVGSLNKASASPPPVAKRKPGAKRPAEKKSPAKKEAGGKNLNAQVMDLGKGKSGEVAP